MKKININTTFYNATKSDPSLREVFINMGFSPMSDDTTYQSVGRVITIKKALDHINMTLDEANALLKKHNMEVTLYE